VDLLKLIQTNTETGTSRRVRCIAEVDTLSTSSDDEVIVAPSELAIELAGKGDEELFGELSKENVLLVYEAQTAKSDKEFQSQTHPNFSLVTETANMGPAATLKLLPDAKLTFASQKVSKVSEDQVEALRNALDRRTITGVYPSLTNFALLFQDADIT